MLLINVIAYEIGAHAPEIIAAVKRTIKAKRSR